MIKEIERNFFLDINLICVLENNDRYDNSRKMLNKFMFQSLYNHLSF